MQSQAFLDRLMSDISRHLPGDLGQLRQEVEHSVRAVLNETLTRLDLISREEFEIQQQVLERTRARLAALEKATIWDMAWVNARLPHFAPPVVVRGSDSCGSPWYSFCGASLVWIGMRPQSLPC